MRLTDERLCELRRFADITKHPTMTDLLDTIEALQQENEQLQAQAARVRDALRKARETISTWDRVNWFECARCKNMRDALAALHEKAERSRGCVSCDGGFGDNTVEFEKLGYTMCPHCGKRLEVEHDHVDGREPEGQEDRYMDIIEMFEELD